MKYIIQIEETFVDVLLNLSSVLIMSEELKLRLKLVISKCTIWSTTTRSLT